MIIFQRSLVRCFTWAIRSTQEARWAPLGEGSVLLWSYLGKWRVASMRVRPGPRNQRMVVVGHARAMFCFDQAASHLPGASPWIPVSIDFPSALNRGRQRVFHPNLSPFLSCSASSLNREGGVLVPFFRLLLSHYLFSFISTECIRASQRFLSERG